MDKVEVLFGKFPHNLRYLREAEGISQTELSKRVHISLGTIQKIENGKMKTLRSDYLGRFSIFYDISVDEILSGDLSNIDSARSRFYKKIRKSIDGGLVESVMLAFDSTRAKILNGEGRKR